MSMSARLYNNMTYNALSLFLVDLKPHSSIYAKLNTLVKAV